MEAERNPNGSRTDPERTPNEPRMDPVRPLNRSRTDPERIPNGPRADPERTPHGPRVEPIYCETPSGGSILGEPSSVLGGLGAGTPGLSGENVL